MESQLLQSLTQLGCSDKECRFFIACYKLGASSIAAIATKARLQRSTAYLVAEQLTEKGLLTQDYRTYNKSYTAVSPRTLIRLLESK